MAKEHGNVQITDNGFLIGSVDFDAAKLYEAESLLQACVRKGDIKMLQDRLKDMKTGSLPFSSLEVAIIRIRCSELLKCAMNGCIEAGGGINWCYYYYYSCVQQLVQAHNGEACLQILKSGLVIFTETAALYLRMNSPKYSPVVEACIRRITAYMPGKISVDLIAQELHLSPKYLSALFCRETGQTMSDFITNLRVQEAQRLLATTSLSLAEVSASLNFCSQSYFNSVFKKKIGMTPKAYRLQRSTDSMHS